MTLRPCFYRFCHRLLASLRRARFHVNVRYNFSNDCSFWAEWERMQIEQWPQGTSETLENLEISREMAGTKSLTVENRMTISPRSLQFIDTHYDGVAACRVSNGTACEYHWL